MSSNASTLVDVGKGAKLDILALKSYLDSLKKQKKPEEPKVPEIQRLSPGGGSESLLKKFSQSSIGAAPQYMQIEEHSFRADEELTMDIKNIDNFLVGKNEWLLSSISSLNDLNLSLYLLKLIDKVRPHLVI